MFLERKVNDLAWLLAELSVQVNDLRGQVVSNADAIEAVVTELKTAVTGITAQIQALQAAAANGEDLTQPLADLTAAANAVAALVPAPAPAPAPAPVVNPTPSS